ncbi:hypothetical protein [Actinoallomurus rhizosphaericola]|uniref:hypothetical protein n=1 Tax=Actinoallomurus rhizosphaericola TaxID=2952536 RepID=UPI0020924DE3|nr:hypothetical protein [Actinoallomurus rhizosphaericola]MCO5999931.1 hypothetical protein [Actinoallomurus rhizosphaericola]
MREDDVQGSMLRRVLRSFQHCLIYMGAGTWSCPEIYDALWSNEAQRQGRLPEQITAYEHLPSHERRLLMRFDDEFRRENER